MRRASKYAVVVAVCLLMPFVPRGLGLLSVSAAPEFALQFDGVDDRVTFGQAPRARRADLHAGAVVQEDGSRDDDDHERRRGA